MEQIPAIDWSQAVRTATGLIAPGPDLRADQIAEVVASLRDAAARSQEHIREVTGLSGPAASEVLVVDRPGWLRAATASADAMLAGTGAVEPASSGWSRAQGRFVGAQVGAVLAVVAIRILGQFDPFADPARLVLVAPNVVAVERSLAASPADFRLWVCLHEQTHRFQFGHAPWLRGHLLGLVAGVLDGDDPHIGWSQLRSPTDLVFGSAAQQDAFDRASAVMSLMEGYADVMMDRAGTEVVPSYPTIRAAFEEHRDRVGLAGLVSKLVGLGLKRAQYRDGAEFCRQVIAATDVPTLNRAFDAPELLPTIGEIHDPQLWLHRI